LRTRESKKPFQYASDRLTCSSAHHRVRTVNPGLTACATTEMNSSRPRPKWNRSVPDGMFRGCVRSDGSTLRLVLNGNQRPQAGCDYRTPTSASEPFTMGWQCELNDPCHAADKTVEQTVRLIEPLRCGRLAPGLAGRDRPHGWPKIEV